MSKKHSGERLEEIRRRYHCTTRIFHKAQERVIKQRDNGFIRYVEFPFLGEKKTHSKDDAREYFDDIKQSLLEQIFLEMVTTFERILFSRIENAAGNIRRTLKHGYTYPEPFATVATSFVKDTRDIYGLNKARNELLQEHLLNGYAEYLREIIDHRNWLAHGKREVGKQSVLGDDIDRVCDILQHVLSVVLNT